MQKSKRKGETVKEQRKEKMKKKKLTSRAVNFFSVSFAQRKPFDLPPVPTTAVPLPLLYVLKRSGLVLLFSLKLNTGQPNQPKTLQNDS